MVPALLALSAMLACVAIIAQLLEDMENPK